MRVTATNPAVAGGSPVGSSSSGAISAGGSPGMDGGASAGGTDLQSSPSKKSRHAGTKYWRQWKGGRGNYEKELR